MNKKGPLLLFLILVLAFFLRVYKNVEVPLGFFCDEASFGYNALTISQNLHDEYGNLLPLYFKAFDDFKSPLSIYLAAPIIKVFGLSVESIRLVGAIFGTLTVLALYLVAKQIFRKYDNTNHRIFFTGEKAALLASFILAISPWHLQFSRSGLWDITIFPLFFLLAFYLTLVSIERKKLLPIAFLAWGITVYSYNVARIIVPVFVLGILLFLLKKARFAWKNAVALIFVFVLVALPSYGFLLGPGYSRWNQVSVFTIKEDSKIKTIRLAVNYLSHFSFDFLFVKGENSFITRHAVLGMGELYFWQLPLVMVGVVFLLRQKDPSGRLLLLALVLYPLAAALSDRSPSSSRAILGSVIFPLITTEGLLGVRSFLIWAGAWSKRFWRWLLTVISLIVVITTFTWYLVLYYRFYPLQSSGSWGWQSGSQEIVTYFKAHQAEYDELIMSSQFNEPGYFFKFFEPQTPCSRCLIGNLKNLNPNKKQLFALSPNEINSDLKTFIKIKKRILSLDGRAAFLIFEP